MELRRLDLSEWAEALPPTGFEPFHRPVALSVVDQYTRGDLELYGGFNGDRAVALLPVFVHNRSVGRTVFSPPPGVGSHRLGPLLLPASPKRRKQEQVASTFVEAVLDHLDVGSPRTLFRTITSTSNPDPRPYKWQGLNVEPAFTYLLDTEDTTADDLLASFSKSLRRDIRDAEDLDLTVTVEESDAIRQVYDETAARYREQDRSYSLSWPYVRDLTAALSEEDRCRVYVARDETGAFLSGITTLYSNDSAYFWQGGMRTTHEGVGINSLLHWRIIEDLVEEPPFETISSYDLMGANSERLCQYKAKFGARLAPYYVVESTGPGMELAKRAYQLVSR